MESYDTLSQAIQALKNRGFTHDFNLEASCISSKELKARFGADRFNVVEVYRFEGMSSTGDASILFAIETDSGLKGTLVDAFGTYSEALTPEILAKLHMVP